MDTTTKLKLKELELLKKKKEMIEGLPHLYGFPWYPWAREFFESTNRMNLLCAGNQLSKSSTQIRKCIHWATAQDLWPKLWETRPLVMWYLYPTKDTATVEFDKKWVEEFLPRGKYKNDPYWGWEAERKEKYIWAIHFRSKVSVYFKTYAQQVKNLQSGTCHALFLDEEVEYSLFPELRMRLAASKGYFHMVFTATLGQQEWKDAIEPGSPKREKFKKAWKRQVSAYDCQYYEDGSTSQWTDKRIAEEKSLMSDPREIQRRIYGKFVLSSGLKYPGFDRERNYVAPKDGLPPPKTWPRYMGVDIGSGKNADKKNSHPAAICFIAVRPDYKYGRIYKAWRGDDESTTAGDVLNKAIELRGHEHMQRQWYDWQCKDFSIIAQRMGEPFEPAEKGHDLGENTVNTIFKHSMLVIDDIGDQHLEKLVNELANLKKDEPKTTAVDDLIDSMRYGVTLIPWNFEMIRTYIAQEVVKKEKPKTVEQQRKEWFLGTKNEDHLDINAIWEDEISQLNDLYEI